MYMYFHSEQRTLCPTNSTRIYGDSAHHTIENELSHTEINDDAYSNKPLAYYILFPTSACMP